jgi:hypothetical protein
MKNSEVKAIITVEIFNRMVSSIESKLNNSNLYNEVKYNKNELNNCLKNDFDQFINILQNVVDKFYLNNYVVDSFMPLFTEDLEFCKKHNLSLLYSIKKLLKFID